MPPSHIKSRFPRFSITLRPSFRDESYPAFIARKDATDACSPVKGESRPPHPRGQKSRSQQHAPYAASCMAANSGTVI